MTVALSSLALQTLWLADNWDEMPWRLHARAVDDGSAWGAPAYSRQFEQWIGSRASDTVTRSVTKPCEHEGGPAGACRACGGTGDKSMYVTRYRYPMRRALSELRRRVHMPPRTVSYADALYRYRVLDFDPVATSAALNMTQEQGNAFLLEAIRLLRSRYSEAPTPGRRYISDAQADAEAAARIAA